MITAESILTLLMEHHLLDTDEPLLPDSDLFALGLDSLAVMHLHLHLEREYGVSLAPALVTKESFATARKLAAFLDTQAKVL
jgi:acyl carrier protein